MTVRDVDKGYDDLQEVIDAMNGASITIGVHDADSKPYVRGQNDPPTTAQIAGVHEFGSPAAGIPPRPFMRPTMDANEDRYADILERRMGFVVDDRMSLRRALGLLGQQISDDIQQKIIDKVRPKLADETIERKRKGYGRVQDADVDPDEPIRFVETSDGGFDSGNPLVDTGQLHRSIDYQVHGGFI